MIPVMFPQANSKFGPPSDFAESQIRTIPAYQGQTVKGSCDGMAMVVVAWLPTEEERIKITNKEPIFLTCMGGLPPHFLSTSFDEAINPA